MIVMQQERPYALWLLPQAQRATALKETVRTLARRFASPIFEPHVTVYSGTTRDFQQTIDHFHQLPAAPMVLEVSGFFQSGIYTQTFGLRFALHAGLRELSERMKHHAANGADHYQLNPHLSLIYANLDEPTRTSLINTTPMPQSPIVFDRLALITPGAVGDWRHVDSWQEQGQRNL